MVHQYEPDSFDVHDITRCLDMSGEKYKVGHRYILTTCPLPGHEDHTPSAQIYLDDFFVNCHVCGRYHITKAFPELRPTKQGYSDKKEPIRKEKIMTEHKYTQFDQINFWESLPLIPRDHKFKTIPLDILDGLGWRWLEDKNSYFIPYFDMSHKCIPFSQMRHLSGDRRFTFLKDAKPIAYGLWNLEPGMKIFVVEGTSDCAVLDYAGVPWIGMPSAASGEILKSMARWCKTQKITIIYAGDKDKAGDQLKEALDETTSYRVKQVPKHYKDWGEFLEAEGIEAVIHYCDEELIPLVLPELTTEEKIMDIMGGRKVLEIVNTPINVSKEPTLSLGDATILF